MGQGRILDACLDDTLHPDKAAKVLATALRDDQYEELATYFRALGEPSRVRLLHCLLDAELCVCDLAALSNLSVAATSQQLRTAHLAQPESRKAPPGRQGHVVLPCRRAHTQVAKRHARASCPRSSSPCAKRSSSRRIDPVSRFTNLPLAELLEETETRLTLLSGLFLVAGIVSSLVSAPSLVQMGIYLTAILVGGMPIVREAWEALTEERRLTIDSLVVIAVVGAAHLGAMVGSRSRGLSLLV